jgi:uncharacterized membrane protein
LGFNLDHTTHIILGAVLVIIGFVVYWTAGKRKKTPKMPEMKK